MAKEKKPEVDQTDKQGEATQENTGVSAGAQAEAIQSPGTGEHPNPQREASDAAETAATEAPKQTDESKKAAEPKVSDALAKAGKALLEGNPALKVVYMTADGLGFAEKNDADNHARGLKNKVVAPVKR